MRIELNEADVLVNNGWMHIHKWNNRQWPIPDERIRAPESPSARLKAAIKLVHKYRKGR